MYAWDMEPAWGNANTDVFYVVLRTGGLSTLSFPSFLSGPLFFLFYENIYAFYVLLLIAINVGTFLYGIWNAVRYSPEFRLKYADRVQK